MFCMLLFLSESESPALPCNNGIFACKGFQKAVRASGQVITFCKVRAHHQNGIAKKSVQDLADLE